MRELPPIATPPVAGYCPLGCGRTLFLGDGGHITCSYLGCPDPAAVGTILDDRETPRVLDLTRVADDTWDGTP